jgi:conjugal transfer pilus assembly protein TraW
MGNLKAVSRSVSLVMVIVIMAVNQRAYGKDFGRSGHTYEVVEQPFLEMIEERLAKVDLEEIRQQMQRGAKERIDNPEAVKGLKPAEKPRVFYFNPAYVLEKDILLPCGRLLYAKGTKINPLDYMEFDRKLYFIDGREAEQIEWMKKILKRKEDKEDREAAEEGEEGSKMEEKIILVGGSPRKLQEELGINVYFDQNGELTSRFRIKSSPAIVMQEGKLLKVIEEKIN